ncbi:MAG TPA: hypothetical protein PKB03_06415, partial [Baekduia sp.]|nr:hypothetical protein [Baekduia sp.]
AAGNPAFGLIIESEGELIVEPMIYAALRPAMSHADRSVANADPGEKVYIISRANDGSKIAYTIMDDRTRKLHQQYEVVEKSISEEDSPI